MNNVLRVVEDWIIKNKPTPGPFREGNFSDETYNKHLPTPGPSQEGIHKGQSNSDSKSPC